MKITKCDSCKKIIDDDVYTLEMHNASRIITFSRVNFDICGKCYINLCKKLRNTEENEDGNT